MRDFQRNQCGGSHCPGKKTGKRKDSGYGIAGYGRAIFQYPTVCVEKRGLPLYVSLVVMPAKAGEILPLLLCYIQAGIPVRVVFCRKKVYDRDRKG